MNAGISTACLYPLETEKSLAALLDLGFRTFEIFFNCPSELEPDFLQNLKDMLQEKGGRVKSIHPFTSGYEPYLFFSEYYRRFEDGLKLYEHYFRAANLLDAEILVLHGEREYYKSRITEGEYFERYHKLYEHAKEFGVTVAQENVNAYRCEDPGCISRMREYLHDDVRFVLDIKQAVRAGFDPYDMLHAMGDKIIHVHVNDNKLNADCLLPGEGNMNFKKVIQLLDSYGYSGDWIIEVYRRNFENFQQLKQSKNFLDALV